MNAHVAQLDALPHSRDAEAYLIAACFCDASDVIPRARARNIGAHSFYDQKHGAVFDCIATLLDEGKPTDPAAVAEALRGTRQLDHIGGYAFLAELSRLLPTTAQSSFYITRVADLARRREMIRALALTGEYLRDETRPLEEAIAPLHPAMAAAAGDTTPKDYEMPWDALISFDGRNDDDCLMGRRYLGRGGGAVIVAPSGMGKSVLTVGLGGCAVLGKPFFGMRMAEMRVLYVQAEDDLGDVAEAVQGFIREHQPTAEELNRLRTRFRILRWNDAAGDRFLSRLRAELTANPADLVLINPLFSFCGCNVSEQADMSRFLRNGLNPILNEAQAACVIIHHTNKPPSDGKDRPDANTDLRYAGSGSSELTNWARAYITLQPVKGAPEGVCKLVFAKRGTRAGIVDETGQAVTSILIEHSKAGLCWVPSDYRVEKDTAGRFKTKFDLIRARELYDPQQSWAENEQAIALDQDVARRTVSRWRKEISDMAA